MPAKSRTYQPARVVAALAAQTGALRDAVRRLCERPDAEQCLARPTRLGEWRVRELLAHLAVQIEWLPAHLDDPAEGRPPLDLPRWAERVGTLAPLLDEQARARSADGFDGDPASVAAAFDRAADALLGALARPEAADPARRFEIRLGSMALTEFLVTRLVETVVHADDLAEALGPEAFPHDRQAVAAVTRMLADAFAELVPGGAVELRVPPFAVVQAVEGPRHTRGTPPNVVETDPLTWIRLATGRADWAEAVDSAALSASGERSDLRTYLPVLG
ncbi:sterol carrier family protein [Kitasatospora purpeofusca]|uniref:sterol carrier family protein n=1 Tax=Kitasatospora purpeofusca TaxID=67352 RepID=UPI0022519899|nr:sterol carrier family protein [Kitasatospora purpeofusca]MCX4754087.1 sterol carrier family protein [Kitasatospora purpeofusca]WSR33535.1 sterol carrier family protein [Kitasatospora purpeofusca]WSR41619.1 sterol carrier family protein [Kitasatospora purpeofusca]